MRPTGLKSKRSRGHVITDCDAQFPYFYLHEYLVGRGLDHLAEWVPWQGEVEDSWKYRTKMFINQLKIRLQFVAPEKCRDIVRNEAHVRLATSVWYATWWIMWVCGIGAAMLAAGWLAAGLDQLLAAALAVDALVLALAVFVKYKIEDFIHYLRVREIVYVLETAHVASLKGYDLHGAAYDAKREFATPLPTRAAPTQRPAEEAGH